MGSPNSIAFERFIEQADTGDVVLWSGSSIESIAVYIVSESLYSHSSIVARHPDTGEKFLLQSVNADLGPDLISNPPKTVPPAGGVQGQPLEEVVQHIIRLGDIPSWVQLDWPDRPDDFDTTVWGLATSVDATPFPADAGTFIDLWTKGRLDTPPVEVDSPMFCSAFVAFILQRAGVIDRSMPINGYEPKDFSTEYPGKVHMVPPTASYRPDLTVLVS